MSTAKRHAISRKGQGGYTFLEIVMVLAILALMALVVERTLASTHETERYLSGVRKATERGQKLAYEIREAVSASRKLWGADAMGQAYLDALQLDRDPIMGTARLPVFDEVNGLGPDEDGDPRTGNVLFFVREADAAPAVADPATGKVRYIDTYRFICIYPRLTGRNVVVDGPNNTRPAVDLVMWRSIAFPSHSQIMAISDGTERENVVRDLYNRFEYDLAWDPNASVSSAFYELDPLGTVNGTPMADPSIDEDLNLSDRGRLVYANLQLARTDASNHTRRPMFVQDDPEDWVPEGFEVKVVGASGSRKVWIRLVVETQAAKGRIAVHPSTVIASTKDL